MKVIADARIRNGRLEMKQRSSFAADLKALADGDYILTVERKKKKRTLMQNAYLHAMLQIFTDSLNELGNKLLMSDVKEMMKYKFLTVDVIDAESGEIIGQRIKGSSELTTTEFCVFVEQIISYASCEFNIQLPLPSEQIKLQID